MRARQRRAKALSKPVQRAATSHRMIQMAIPPREIAYQVSPFTAKVIALPANDAAALVFTRARETVSQIAGKVGAAIRAAQRREPEKQFVKRRIVHNGLETYAIWRVR